MLITAYCPYRTPVDTRDRLLERKLTLQAENADVKSIPTQIERKIDVNSLAARLESREKLSLDVADVRFMIPQSLWVVFGLWGMGNKLY
jgi:hypothetical protein